MRELSPYIVLTPEQVPIVLIPGGIGRRLLATILDLLIIGCLVSALAGLCRFLPGGLKVLLVTTGSFAIFWGYHVVCEVRFAGQSLGKRLLQLRVSDARGLPVTLHQSMARNAARVLDMVPLGGLGLVSCLMDAHRRRIGDRLADTLVISETRARPHAFKALSRVSINSLDVPRLRRAVAHRLSVEEREFMLSLCLRAESLSETARYDLFETVGTHYRTRFAIADEHLSNEKVVRQLLALCAPGGGERGIA